MKKVDWDSIGVVVFLLITFICKLFSCVLHGVYAFQDGRRGLSTFKNMPFLPREGRFLRARRAYTRMQSVTRWFLVGYMLCCRRCYLRVLRVVSLVGCKDISSSCCPLFLTVFTPAIAVTLCEICMPEAFWSLTPSPSPNGEGSDHRGYPYYAACVVMGMCHWLVPSIGIL